MLLGESCFYERYILSHGSGCSSTNDSRRINVKLVCIISSLGAEAWTRGKGKFMGAIQLMEIHGGKVMIISMSPHPTHRFNAPFAELCVFQIAKSRGRAASVSPPSGAPAANQLQRSPASDVFKQPQRCPHC